MRSRPFSLKNELDFLLPPPVLLNSAAAVAARAAFATSASDAPPIMSDSTAVTALASASSSSASSLLFSASLSCKESSSYFFISSCRRPLNCDGNNAGKYRWMKEKISTCPTGVSGMMRMMMNGTKVKMSSVVRRMVCTSRGRKVEPITARPKNRAEALMSPPSIFTPRAMNSAPSFAFSSDSLVVRLTRSPKTLGDSDDNPSPSFKPSRDFKSGMSVASSVRSSSSMLAESPVSTIQASFLKPASIALNSAAKSSTSSARSGVSSDGASHASSSNCAKMRSISSCSVLVAKTRRKSRTSSSLSRMDFANRTRDNESLP
mmetsp:Transcript_6670/g.28439  ORF Transcript_6670/g.28439 Transcript_6670/m.28439 type:complete len:319 (-) Transcript_6670:1026-1982(-)